MASAQASARTIASFFALDKLARFMTIISGNGGMSKSAYKLWRNDTLKDGQLMGTDALGNKYFENPYYMLGRSRWVEFNSDVKWEYDASQVTPEWYGWLHYKTDRLPCEDCAKLCLTCCCWCNCWLQPHSENMTNTVKAYYPYSTTREKVNMWDGFSICTRESDE